MTSHDPNIIGGIIGSLRRNISYHTTIIFFTMEVTQTQWTLMRNAIIQLQSILMATQRDIAQSHSALHNHSSIRDCFDVFIARHGQSLNNVFDICDRDSSPLLLPFAIKRSAKHTKQQIVCLPFNEAYIKCLRNDSSD